MVDANVLNTTSLQYIKVCNDHGGKVQCILDHNTIKLGPIALCFHYFNAGLRTAISNATCCLLPFQ